MIPDGSVGNSARQFPHGITLPALGDTALSSNCAAPPAPPAVLLTASSTFHVKFTAKLPVEPATW